MTLYHYDVVKFSTQHENFFNAVQETMAQSTFDCKYLTANLQKHSKYFRSNSFKINDVDFIRSNDRHICFIDCDDHRILDLAVMHDMSTFKMIYLTIPDVIEDNLERLLNAAARSRNFELIHILERKYEIDDDILKRLSYICFEYAFYYYAIHCSSANSDEMLQAATEYLNLAEYFTGHEVVFTPNTFIDLDIPANYLQRFRAFQCNNEVLENYTTRHNLTTINEVFLKHYLINDVKRFGFARDCPHFAFPYQNLRMLVPNYAREVFKAYYLHDQTFMQKYIKFITTLHESFKKYCEFAANSYQIFDFEYEEMAADVITLMNITTNAHWVQFIPFMCWIYMSGLDKHVPNDVLEHLLERIRTGSWTLQTILNVEHYFNNELYNCSNANVRKIIAEMLYAHMRMYSNGALRELILLASKDEQKVLSNDSEAS